MTHQIRLLESSDQAAVFSLEEQIFGSDAWSEEVFAAELDHPDSWYLVAEHNGAVVGYGGLRCPPVTGAQADIQTLAVQKTERGQGIGQRILDGLLAEASRRGAGQVFLEVRADNPAAIALYRSRGFDEISRRRRYYQPDGVDAIVMCRADGEGNLQ